MEASFTRSQMSHQRIAQRELLKARAAKRDVSSKEASKMGFGMRFCHVRAEPLEGATGERTNLALGRTLNLVLDAKSLVVTASSRDSVSKRRSPFQCS